MGISVFSPTQEQCTKISSCLQDGERVLWLGTPNIIFFSFVIIRERFPTVIIGIFSLSFIFTGTIKPAISPCIIFFVTTTPIFGLAGLLFNYIVTDRRVVIFSPEINKKILGRRVKLTKDVIYSYSPSELQFIRINTIIANFGSIYINHSSMSSGVIGDKFDSGPKYNNEFWRSSFHRKGLRGIDFSVGYFWQSGFYGVRHAEAVSKLMFELVKPLRGSGPQS